MPPGSVNQFNNVLHDRLTDVDAARATSRTQSALLEAMEENQVTVDGVSRPVPQFFTSATTLEAKFRSFIFFSFFIFPLGGIFFSILGKEPKAPSREGNSLEGASHVLIIQGFLIGRWHRFSPFVWVFAILP